MLNRADESEFFSGTCFHGRICLPNRYLIKGVTGSLLWRYVCTILDNDEGNFPVASRSTCGLPLGPPGAEPLDVTPTLSATYP
jgi:hypothetical protein